MTKAREAVATAPKTHFTSANWTPDKSKPEVTKGSSLTVPDMALSISQILENATRGINPQIRGLLPVYNEDILLPDVRKMDLTDIDQYKRGFEMERFRVKNELEQLQVDDNPNTPDRLQQLDDVLKELQEARKAKAAADSKT